MASLDDVMAGFALGVDRSAPLEIHLRNAYQRTLNELVRIAARNFSRRAITHLTAASRPDWQMPDRDEVLSIDEARASLLAATQPTRIKMVTRMMGDALAAVGVSFTVTNPLAQHVLSTLGKRITEITDRTRDAIMASLADSHEKGLSIPHAARAMSRDVRATNITRSTLIARTEFIGAQNGSSLASVQVTGAATMKTWLATEDNRTRPDHSDADGQTVPLNDVFNVGGYEMRYPGDQNAPAEEVCNCRCTLTYQ